jgi:hypothetical protein
MTNKPGSLQLYLKDASQLVRRDTLLAAAQKMEGLKPLVQRQIARIKDGPFPYRERLAAFAAFLEPIALDPFWMLLILLGANTPEDIEILPDSAARAYRAIRRNDAHGGFESHRFVLEMGLIRDTY